MYSKKVNSNRFINNKPRFRRWVQSFHKHYAQPFWLTDTGGLRENKQKGFMYIDEPGSPSEIGITQQELERNIASSVWVFKQERINIFH